jgi:hypothetical protein
VFHKAYCNYSDANKTYDQYAKSIFKKNGSSGMLRRVALIRTDVSKELSISFIRVTRIGGLGTTLAVISNRRTLRRNAKKYQLDISSQRASVAYYG